MIPSPDDPRAPKYWMYETGGELRPAIERLIRSETLSSRDIGMIRAYFTQWIDSPAWDLNPHWSADSRATLESLRADAPAIKTNAHILDWLRKAVDFGVDPL